MEEIKSSDGKVVAIVIRKRFKTDGKNFVSKSHFALQLGISSYKKGDKIKPHVHRHRKLAVKQFQELVYVKSGMLSVNLYDSNKELFKSLKLLTGDLIFFIGNSGHGFEILKDTTIIEVKQGPSLEKEKDKVLIE